MCWQRSLAIFLGLCMYFIPPLFSELLQWCRVSHSGPRMVYETNEYQSYGSASLTVATEWSCVVVSKLQGPCGRQACPNLRVSTLLALASQNSVNQMQCVPKAVPPGWRLMRQTAAPRNIVIASSAGSDRDPVFRRCTATAISIVEVARLSCCKPHAVRLSSCIELGRLSTRLNQGKCHRTQASAQM